MKFPRRFKIGIAVANRPFERAFRFGVYFPTTDLCVNDMGGRSTGLPAGVEWIDAEEEEIPAEGK